MYQTIGHGTQKGWSIWRIVSGTEVAPEDARELDSKRYNGRTYKALVLSIDPSLLYLLEDPVDPVAVWAKLEEQFQKSHGSIDRLTLET